VFPDANSYLLTMAKVAGNYKLGNERH